MNVTKYRLLKGISLLLLLIFKIFCDYILVNQLPLAAGDSTIYGLNPNPYKIIIGYLFLGLSLCFVRKILYRTTLSSIIIFFLLFLYYIPIVSIIGQCNLPYEFFFLVNLYWLNIIFFMNILYRKNIHGIVFKINWLKVNHAFLLLLVFSVISTYLYNGLSINFEFNDVYEVREESLNVNYLLGLTKNAYVMFLGPVFICFYLLKKEYLWALLAIILMLVLFSIGKDKAALFIILPVIFMSFFKRINFRSIKLVVVLSLCLLMVLSYVEYKLYDSHFICYFIVRRTFFEPSYMNYLYYDFFSETTKLYFTDHIFLLSRLLPDIHPYGVLELISRKYFSGTMGSPNTGMFAEGYMQLGILGTIIYPLIFVYLLRFIDRITSYYPLLLKVATGVAIGLVLINLPITHSHFVVHFGFTSLFMILINENCKRNFMNK